MAVVKKLTAAQVRRLLDLRPLEIEGGFFRETYRADETLPARALPRRYGGKRAFATAIYYLLTPRTFSRLHRLASDEIFHFLLGDPVRMLQLPPDGAARIVTLGPDITAGQQLQVVVPRSVWQGCTLKSGGRWALMSTTVAPGFDYADYEPADRAEMVRLHPQHRKLIERLTR